MHGCCIDCKEGCTEDSFVCHHCKTDYCSRCEQKWTQPPCRCLIDSKGIASVIKYDPRIPQDVFDVWDVCQVLEHCHVARIASASINQIIFTITFAEKSNLQHRCTSLCEIGSISQLSQKKFFSLKLVRDYVNSCSPLPSAFLRIQRDWTEKRLDRQPISLNTECLEHDWKSLFIKGKEDVDSMEIRNFPLTRDTINQKLITLVPRQLDVGSVWSSVEPPPRFRSICGPRPTIMVYIGLAKHEKKIKRLYADYLLKRTGRVFKPASTSSTCMFSQAAGSVDTISLMEEWLRVITQHATTSREEELNEVEKMKLVHITYHGWKSQPEEIRNGFTKTLDGLYADCRRVQPEFKASFDLAQKYIAAPSQMVTASNCMSTIRIPVFGFATAIPGFRQTKSDQKHCTFSMFGPLTGESNMGSIMIDRTDDDITIFPKNVSRVKIYPSVVNFIKQTWAPPRILKRGLTNKQLNTYANNVCDKYLSSFTSPECIQYKDIFMAFRIECTMQLVDGHSSLDELNQQFDEMMIDILTKLQPVIRVTMIAIEDISNMAKFCLSRYYKMCIGKSSTIFRDQKMARAMVLSLWQVSGYHCHKATTNAHKTYLFDIDMDDFETVGQVEIKEIKGCKPQLDTAINWSQEPASRIQVVIRALRAMNLYEITKLGSKSWYYMYRKVCDIDDNKSACTWCYSSKARLRKVAKLWTEQPKLKKASLIACKSNSFGSLGSLAADVCKRIEHHNNDPESMEALIASMFLPMKKENKALHASILNQILLILKPEALESTRQHMNNCKDQESVTANGTDMNAFHDMQPTNSSITGNNDQKDSDGIIGDFDDAKLEDQQTIDMQPTGNNDQKDSDGIIGDDADDAVLEEQQTIDDQSSDVLHIDDGPSNNSADSLIPAADLQQPRVNGMSKDKSTYTSTQSILCGRSVLARSSASLPWRQAFVMSCCGTEYTIQFHGEGDKQHQVSEKNIKNFDWNYWNMEMQNWSYRDFKEQIPVIGTQFAGQAQSEPWKGLVALENLRVGTVVVEHTEVTACDEGGEAGTIEQSNCELLWVDNNVGFVVTTKQVQKGEMLIWHCKLRVKDRKVTSDRSKEAPQMTQIEPSIIQSIMLSMQGNVNDAQESFDFHAYMVLWKLRMPVSKTKNISIANTAFESNDFGSSIKPFLHQATIDLLLMEDITNWLDIDANNSFIIHLALAMKKHPLALHTMFARNCTRNLQAKQDRVWTPDVLATVLPSSLNFKIMILVKQAAENTYICKIYGSDSHNDEEAPESPESRVILVQDGKDYSWLKDARIDTVDIEKFQQDCQYDDYVKWETLTKKSVFIQGCHTSKTEAPAEWKDNVWKAACRKVELNISEKGKWLKKPPGFNQDLSLQDGSLTPQSFSLLHDVLGKRYTCGLVADLGSEAGHAVAQFAFKPFVNQVIGIEIQYAWVAYSVIMMQHIQSESCKHDYYLADIHIIHGSFLDTKQPEWEAALSSADLCFCNNFNWDKGSVACRVPQPQQALTGEFRNRTNANVAHLLVDKMKLNSHVIVFDKTSFASQAYQPVQTLDLMATWSTMGTTKVEILRMCPTHFRVLKKALQTLCQAKNCNFETLPKDWWQKDEVQKNSEGFLRLKNHVLKQDYFKKSNASVHLGWNVTAPMIVCIKKFPDKMNYSNIEREMIILNQVANKDDASAHSVIRFLGTDIDNKGGTVLIFEMVCASCFNSDLENMSTQNIAHYMYRLLQALNYVHEQNIVHRDVKPANFLHNFQSETFRLIDFGSAVIGTKGFIKTGGGTRGFRAPEILIGKQTQTAAVDVWSAGIILLSLITGKPYILTQHGDKVKGNVVDATNLKEIGLIVGKSEMHQLHDQQCDEYGDGSQHETQQCDEYGDGSQHETQTGWAAKALQSVIKGRNWKNDDHALDLLSKMLNVQPSKRITSADALKHPFLQSAMKRP